MQPQTVLSFDVEEHWRIEAASGLTFDEGRKSYYAARVGPATQWILDELGRHGQRATFYVVGQLARSQPNLVWAIHRAGHEVACHGWDHRRVLVMTPAQFREDIHKTRDALEQITGEAVLGYRAPTFSVVRQTAWAIDVLAEEGILYDSSIYPVRHDRYGVPDAPRGPFRARGERNEILELPLARLDVLGMRLPAGGGGYFRLFPLFVMERALQQIHRDGRPPVAVLYFHPWEFDPRQEKLPLGPVSKFRTYVGVERARPRLSALLGRYRFSRAIDVARHLSADLDRLPAFEVAVAAPAARYQPAAPARAFA